MSRRRQEATPGEENNIAASELGKINNASLSYVRSLSIKEIEKRGETVSVTSLESAKDLQQAKEVLSKYGIGIVKSFLPAD